MVIRGLNLVRRQETHISARGGIPGDQPYEKMMAIRFRIGTLLIVTAVVALFTGLFAPELRAWNRNSFLLFTAIGVVTAIVLASFTPVWIVLFRLRNRSRRGLETRLADYAAVIVAILSAIGILIGIFVSITKLVVR